MFGFPTLLRFPLLVHVIYYFVLSLRYMAAMMLVWIDRYFIFHKLYGIVANLNIRSASEPMIKYKWMLCHYKSLRIYVPFYAINAVNWFCKQKKVG